MKKFFVNWFLLIGGTVGLLAYIINYTALRYEVAGRIMEAANSDLITAIVGVAFYAIPLLLLGAVVYGLEETGII